MKISVLNHDGSKISITSLDGRRLSATLSEAGIYLPMPCGGRGSCGKCRVRFLRDDRADNKCAPAEEDTYLQAGKCSVSLCVPAPTEADRRLLSQDEIAAGIRLACQCIPTDDCMIELPQASSEEQMQVQVGDGLACNAVHSESLTNNSHPTDDYGIAIDLGTTTIAMELIGLSDDRTAGTYSGVNHQRMYGADVMSRIAYTNASEAHARQLRELVQNDLKTGIDRLREACQGRIVRIVLCGNATMVHLLMGLSTAHLGEAPFTAETLDAIHTDIEGIPCDIFPAIQAFVGGDIVSGVYAASMDTSDDLSLLLDLGTNGEMVLGNREHLITTSVSAGPAFEGGNIRFGMPSVPGAINSVMIVGRFCRTTTIGGAPAVGICGTGILDAVSELLRNHIIDEHGTLIDEYLHTGYPLVKQRGSQVGFGSCLHPHQEITLSQEDIRQVQLAKASVRAGMDVLLNASGYQYADVKSIYLAGGFGFHLDVKKAVRLGIFPEEIADRVLPVGNAALAGARQFLLHPKDADRICTIPRLADTVSLADSEMFHERYIQCVDF